jgi:hypothetical protein
VHSTRLSPTGTGDSSVVISAVLALYVHKIHTRRNRMLRTLLLGTDVCAATHRRRERC